MLGTCYRIPNMDILMWESLLGNVYFTEHNKTSVLEPARIQGTFFRHQRLKEPICL